MDSQSLDEDEVEVLKLCRQEKGKKEPLDFLEHRFQRPLAPEQIQQPCLQRVVTHRPIDLGRIVPVAPR